MGIFDKIDFNNLPKKFNENDVREEIIAPLLKVLGYSRFDEENRIIRNPKLQHPYVQFGTKSEKIKIEPDYLIQVKKKNCFIIEAKAPSENICTGKHVEQAYSYAINREVQIKRFVLCNGKEIIIFDVDNKEPLLYFEIANATEEKWGRLFELLSPAAFINPNIFNYKLDYGLWCVQNGIKPEVIQYFYNCKILDVGMLEENLFSFTAVIKRDEELMASFDFDISLFEDFMSQVPEDLKEIVRNFTRKSPFKYITSTEDESFPLRFSACLSEVAIQNENEVYVPLKVKEFLKLEE